MGSLLHAFMGHIHPEHLDAARIRMNFASDLSKQGGFACPIGANDEATLARGHAQINVLGDHDVAKTFAQLGDL